MMSEDGLVFAQVRGHGKASVLGCVREKRAKSATPPPKNLNVLRVFL